jgi:histidinol dehydrogenase
MERISYKEADFGSRLRPLLDRTAFDPEIEASVAQILADVRRRGDEALCEYARTFDGAELTPEQFAVSAAEIEEATLATPASVRKAIRMACRQIKNFSSQRLPAHWSYSPRKGVVLGERFTPLSRIAAYVPGGTAPLISTVLHTVTLAAVAGVPEIVVITPPGKDGTVPPALLYAASYAGATEIYRLGGVYGVGAAAFGTATIRKVEKIVGPGNAYVTAAKRQVYGYVALDQVAGPSEIMILADESAKPAFIAADMLSQAEHGSGREQAVLVTTSAELITAVEEEIQIQRAQLARQECLGKVIDHGMYFIEVESMEQAADLASQYAPEHLEIMAPGAGVLAKKVTAAGAIFLGPWTPEPVGDFVAGPSHVLPTGGAAKYFSGLTVDQFFRRMSVVNYQKSALKQEVEAIQKIAGVEGLDAHSRSAGIRLD